MGNIECKETESWKEKIEEKVYKLERELKMFILIFISTVAIIFLLLAYLSTRNI
jgi:hypothetical protein